MVIGRGVVEGGSLMLLLWQWVCDIVAIAVGCKREKTKKTSERDEDREEREKTNVRERKEDGEERERVNRGEG